MVSVGVPAWVSDDLLAKFPHEAAVTRIESQPERQIDIEFWVAPTFQEAARVWPHLSGVRAVQSMLAGVDWAKNLDLGDVILCDGQGLHNIPTAEWTVTAILSSLKYFPFYRDLQRSGDWQRVKEVDAQYRQLHRGQSLPTGRVMQEELYGQRVMIVGYGSIGKSIEERLLPFGVEIVRVARHAREGVEPIDRLLELLPQADIVVLIVPLTEETTGLIGAKHLAAMKQGALLVNAARGPVVHTDALLEALQSGHIRAAIDVTDPEPLPKEHPLWSAPNLLITPHVAGSSPRFVERAITFAAAQVERYIKGEPLLNIVSGSY
jgi:phosphoglycerate dehydrogenase-like enzyme